LHRGTTLDKVIAMLAATSPRVTAPIVLFTYFNPIMARGLDKFCADIRAAGASGLLVPDIPLEETGLIREAVNKHGMELVLLTTPTTGDPLSSTAAHFLSSAEKSPVWYC
jgi:tryptophan synthase alpha chain